MEIVELKTDQEVVVGDGIKVKVVKIETAKDRVRLGIDAPRFVPVRRGELEAFNETEELESQ